MKCWAALPLFLGVGALLHTPAANQKQVLLLAGDSQGSLSPCGCTKPMTGGLKRLATAIKAYRPLEGGSLFINGALTAGDSRQEILKAQTLAEALLQLHPDAIRLSESDEHNLQAAASLRSFLSDRILEPDHALDANRIRVLSDRADLGSQIREAMSQGLQIAMLVDGGKEEARTLARKYPEVGLIQYRLDGRAEWSREGSTLLATPGSKLRDLLVIQVEEGVLSDPRVVPLDEHVADDASTAAIYRSYLSRLDRENLIAQADRSGNEKFAGSARCVSCHPSAGKVWAHSRHAGALKSLELEGHGKDPECVPCHVVGLDRTYGFRDRNKTPNLSNVGCESCHGAGMTHVVKPRIRLPKVSEKRCVTCHTSEQSPGYNFQEFWKQIRH